MGFVQFLKSLDDFLYEVMSWLIFYPITLWRAVTRPLRMMDYADSELSDSEDKQYDDTLSPPLFLLISLLISHAIELATVGESSLVRDTLGLAGLIGDDTSLLMLRLLLFSVFPLVMATRLVRLRGIGLTRDTLRPPFYSQCYVAAPFVLVLGIGGTIIEWRSEPAPILAGAAIVLLALLWYGVLQARWFAQHRGTSLVRGFATASVAMIESLAIVIGISWLFG